MVVVLGNNEFVMLQQNDSVNILALGRKFYELKSNDSGRKQLTRVKRPHPLGVKLQKGNYWLFDVVSNPQFTPGMHLSMISENGDWEGYILRTHFPTKIGESCILSPTLESIARPHKRLLRSTTQTA